MTDANGVRVAARTVEDHLKRIPDGYKGPFIKGKDYVETVTEDDDEEAASSEESNQTY